MVEKSTIILTSIILVLSFKDLILINPNSAQDQQTAKTNNDQNKPIVLDNDFVDKSKQEFDNEMENDNIENFENDNLDLSENKADKSSDFVKTIPSLKMKSNVQTLKILYCYSCGYRNAFEQYSQLIKSRFPELNIIGENYAPSGYKLILAQFFSSFKLVLIGLLLFGQNPFTYLNMATPNIWNWATQNKLYACLMIFFISNAIETNLITSGAFEIYLNDMQIWSKIQSDRMPHEKELMQILDMNFNFESEKNAAFGTGKF